MSNQNTGDKPQITQGEWTKFYQDDDIIIDSEHRSFAIACITGGVGDKEDEANSDLIITAGNLSHKYGSLEAMEQQLIGLKEQHQNDILLAQAASEQITKLEKRVKELDESIKLPVDAIRSNHTLWGVNKIKAGAFSWHAHNNLLQLEKLLTPKQ